MHFFEAVILFFLFPRTFFNVGFRYMIPPDVPQSAGLSYNPEISDVPTCTTRCPARHNDASDPSSERWSYWARNGR
jgi:hypothetical protein